jgi:putative transposase
VIGRAVGPGPVGSAFLGFIGVAALQSGNATNVAHWAELTPFFDYPPEIRKIIYTTNAIESLNSSLRKISRHRNLFPSTDSLYKLFYLALKNIATKWKRPISNWSAALNYFTIQFEDRMPRDL